MSNNWRFEATRRADLLESHRLSTLPPNYCRKCKGTGVGGYQNKFRIDGSGLPPFTVTDCPACGGKGS